MIGDFGIIHANPALDAGSTCEVLDLEDPLSTLHAHQPPEHTEIPVSNPIASSKALSLSLPSQRGNHVVDQAIAALSSVQNFTPGESDAYYCPTPQGTTKTGEPLTGPVYLERIKAAISVRRDDDPVAKTPKGNPVKLPTINGMIFTAALDAQNDVWVIRTA